MDSFFGIGAPELIVILLLAGIVMGPKRIQQAAFWLGKVTAQLQGVSRGFMRQLNAELSSADEHGDLNAAMKEMQDLRRQLKELKSEVTSIVTAPMAEGQKAVNEAKNAVNHHTISPQQFDRPMPGEAQESTNKQTPADLPNLVEVSDDLE